VSLLGMVTKEEEIGWKVSGLEENTLETRPVKTIELMKTPKDNRCCNIPDFRFGNFIMSFMCICTSAYFSKLKRFCFGQKPDFVLNCIC
jgi:hypothetical protein